MTIESQLRQHLRSEYDDLELPQELATTARLRGGRLRRRRRLGVTALALLLLAVVGGGVTAAVRHSPTHTLEVSQVPPDNPIATYVAQWQHGDFDSIRSKMTPATRAAISADALRQGLQEPGQGGFLGVTRAVTVGQMNQGTLRWQHRTSYLTVVNSSTGITGLLLYDEPSSAPLSPSALPAAQARLGVVLSDQVAGRFATVHAMVSPSVAGQLPAALLASSWQQLRKTFGTVRGFIPGTLSGPESVNGAHVLRGDILLTGGRLTETLAYDDAGQLVGITFTLPSLH